MNFPEVLPIPNYENIDFADPSIFNHKPFDRRRTKIMATLTNSNTTVVDIQKLIEAGMNAAHFLTSHLSTDDKIKLIGKIDKATKLLAKKYGLEEWPCATCMELKTCHVSTGLIENNRPCITLKQETEVILTYDTAEFDKCNERQIFVDNPCIVKDVTIGMEISIKQDKIILQVTEILENTVKCIVIKEGTLVNLEPVYMSGASRNRPFITKKDLEFVKFSMEYQVDIIIVNYVRHADTLKAIKKYIGKNTRRPFIVSGICTYEGLCNVDDIIKESDGLLFPREILAYELDRKLFYRMTQIQKSITGKCRQAAKPLFISGQIFKNYFNSSKMAHQDVSDVANALLEGVFGFVLNDYSDIDTLKLAIESLSDVSCTIEPLTNNKIDFERNLLGMNLPLNAAMATAVSSVLLANQTLASVIVIPTMSGHTVYHLNCMHPACIIIAITTNINTFRLLQVYRSVLPLFFTGVPHLTWTKMMINRINYAVEYAVDKGILMYGDYYITLEKGTEESSYCDTVKACKVVTKKSQKFVCEVTADYT